MRRLTLSLSVLLLLVAGSAHASAPPVLSYQGFLTDSVGNPVTGVWTLTFGLFGAPTGGEALFVDSQDVTTDKGLFSIYLGSEANPLPVPALESGSLWLEITVETDTGPVALKPRQQVVSDPYALFAQSCQDSLNLGGHAADTFVTVQQLPDVCIAPGDLPGLLAELGYVPGGGLDEAALAAWLLENGYSPCVCYGDDEVGAYLAANGYVAGPHFSGAYADLTGAPDLSGFATAADLEGLATTDEVVALLAEQGAVLLADGSVALEGALDFAGNEAQNFVVHNAPANEPPDEMAAGQLWFDTTNKVLKAWDGEQWMEIGAGGIGADLACDGCVDPGDVSFNYAGSTGKGGAAAVAADVQCVACIDGTEVSIAWAKGTLPGGDAMHALTADTATTALQAQDLDCPGCVGSGDIDPAAMAAQLVSFNDAQTQLGAATVQGAIEKLVGGGAGGEVNEGNGTIVPYVEQWGLPAYGKATTYLHLMNPVQPKVLMHLYAGEPSGFSTSNNLVVAYDFAPNQYSGSASGTAGEMVLQVGNPSLFTVGAHIMVHQTVGKNGNGTDAGKWELNQVLDIQGATLLLAKPLQNTYVSCGNDCGRAQAVVAASYNQLEVVNGGNVHPSSHLRDNSDRRGSILYIRARKIVVKTGGKIHADSYGFDRGDNWWGNYETESGHSQCKAQNDVPGTAPNCSGGGGGGYYNNNWSNVGAGGGGGNKAAGQNGGGPGSSGGKGGLAWGDANLGALSLGGGGGGGYYARGGYGAGIVVLGAETIIIETGATVTANGSNGDCPWGNSTSHSGGGGGAGGSIVLFANEIINNGTLEAKGGLKSDCSNGAGKAGGDGGEGWVIQKPPTAGVVNESYAKGVEVWVDGQNITPEVGDPNAKGYPAWDADSGSWGGDGLSEWSTGPLDLTGAANWTLGEHKVELKETGGAGGDVKMFTYVIYPFTKSSAPVNDTCEQPVMLDLSGPATVTGTTEDVMGKIKATDASTGPFCGGSGGPDVVYGFVLEDWRQLAVSVTAAFTPRIYIRKGSCTEGEVVACGTDSFATNVFEPGTYYLIVDSDGNLQKGDFTLKVVPSPPDAPANDTCGGPEPLNFQNNMAKASGMTLFSNDDSSAACGGAGSPENVYQFVVPAGTSKLAIDLDADFSPAIYIAKENCSSAPIACIPAATYEMGWPGPGTYYLFVDGKGANQKGLYTLTVTLTQ